MVAIYEDFVSEVDPEKVLDLLIQNKTVKPKLRHHLKNKVTTEDQCEALFDLLFSSPKDNGFILLKEVLKEHYPGIVERIDSQTTDEYQKNSDKKSTMRLESSIVVFGDKDPFKIKLNHPVEVSTLKQLSVGVCHWMQAAVYCSSIFVTEIGQDFDEIWRFDARYSKWNKCASLRKCRWHHSVAFVDHILYICGGRRFKPNNAFKGLIVSSNEGGPLDDVEAYDTIDKKCSVVGKLAYAVYDAVNCVPYKTSLYIFGGINAQREAVNSAQVYDTKFNTCTIITNQMPRNSAHLRAVLFQEYVILLGKMSCLLYNFDTETWKVRDQFKSDVAYFGMAVYNENLFIIGGRGSNMIPQDDIRSVPIVNILSDEPIEWKHHTKLPKPFKVLAFGKLDFLVKQL